MKWTVSLPRVVAEDDKPSVQVEADTIEDAIKAAAPKLGAAGRGGPNRGQVFNVHARVEVCAPSSLPLKSV